MEIGDLVKRQFHTNASIRRAKAHGIIIAEIGLITQIPWQGAVSDRVWVMWPSKFKHVLHSRDSLEVLNESW